MEVDNETGGPIQGRRRGGMSYGTRGRTVQAWPCPAGVTCGAKPPPRAPARGIRRGRPSACERHGSGKKRRLANSMQARHDAGGRGGHRRLRLKRASSIVVARAGAGGDEAGRGRRGGGPGARRRPPSLLWRRPQRGDARHCLSVARPAGGQRPAATNGEVASPCGSAKLKRDLAGRSLEMFLTIIFRTCSLPGKQGRKGHSLCTPPAVDTDGRSRGNRAQFVTRPPEWLPPCVLPARK